MTIKLKKRTKLTVAVLMLLYLPLFIVSADSIRLSELIVSSLKENADIISANYDVAAERLKYESIKAGSLPRLGFTTDTGNNPLYGYSNANELSSTFSYERYQKHKIGGGLSLDVDLPTGGSMSLSGAGNLNFSLADEAEDWSYLVSPAASLYLRQPLFIDRLNGRPLRLDSLKLADELALLSVSQTELNRVSFENSLIILITRTAVVLNSLRNSYDILQKRIVLEEQRLDLARQDEQAGKLNSLDRLSEELQLRRQQEAIIELEFQIESAVLDLENLTGITGIRDFGLDIVLSDINVFDDVNPLNSANVKNSEAAKRIVEISSTVIQNGTEPVFEISGLYRRSDTDTADALATAFEDAAEAEMNLTVSMSVSFPIVDWGEIGKKNEAEKISQSASEERLRAAQESSILQTAAAKRNIRLIEEKFELLKKGLEYDRILLSRERVRLDAGLTSELAVKTIQLDLEERESQISQLEDEKNLALLELYNTGGYSLNDLFR